MDQEGTDGNSPSRKKMALPRSSGHDNLEHDFTQGVSHREQEQEEAAAGVDASQVADAKVDAAFNDDDTLEEYSRCGIELNCGLRQSHTYQIRLKSKLTHAQQQCSVMNKKSALLMKKLAEMHRQSESTIEKRKTLDEEIATHFPTAHEVMEKCIQNVSQNATCIDENMSNIDNCLEKDASEISELKSEMTLSIDNTHNKNSQYSSELSTDTQNYKESTLLLYNKILDVDRKIEEKIEALKRSKLESLRKKSLIKDKEALLKADLEETAYYDALIENEKIKLSKNKKILDDLTKEYEKKSASFKEEENANSLKLKKIQAETKEEKEKSKKHKSEVEKLMQKEIDVSREVLAVQKQIRTLCLQIEMDKRRSQEKKMQLELMSHENERLKQRWKEHERLKLVEEASLKEYQNLGAFAKKKRDEYDQLLKELDEAKLKVVSTDKQLKKMKTLTKKVDLLDEQYADALKRDEVISSDSQRVMELEINLEEELTKIQLTEERNLSQLKDIESLQAVINALKLRAESLDNEIEQKTKNVRQQKEKLESFRNDYLAAQKMQRDCYNIDIAYFKKTHAAQRETLAMLLNELIQHCHSQLTTISDLLNHYEKSRRDKKKNRKAISEAWKEIQLTIKPPILRMAEYINFTQKANRDSVDVQIKIYNEFTKVCNSVWKESVIDPDKIFNIAQCLYGLKPLASPSPDTSVVSSTTAP